MWERKLDKVNREKAIMGDWEPDVFFKIYTSDSPT